jgi:hypothetical protein
MASSAAINHSASILSTWASRTIQSRKVLIAEAGNQDMQQRACAKWKNLLNDYEMPGIDAAVDEALLDFMDRRKSSMADAWY